MLTLEQVQKDPYVLSFIKHSNRTLDMQGFTEHGVRHANLVAERARMIATKIGLNKREQELAAIAGFCHDMANFIGRTQHHYWGSLLMATLFKNECEPDDLTLLMQAVAVHDKEDMRLVHPVAAVMVLADKSDVHRSRVQDTRRKNIDTDIHDRVNYYTTDNTLTVDPKKRTIVLKMKIDTSKVEVIEYFEIFTDRMVYCGKAAKFLGYKFQLYINEFKLV
ncbi:MAG: phosphohydrolase [bacterium]|nr:phosphohydrolase [bacterium]